MESCSRLLPTAIADILRKIHSVKLHIDRLTLALTLHGFKLSGLADGDINLTNGPKTFQRGVVGVIASWTLDI